MEQRARALGIAVGEEREIAGRRQTLGETRAELERAIQAPPGLAEGAARIPQLVFGGEQMHFGERRVRAGEVGIAPQRHLEAALGTVEPGRGPAAQQVAAASVPGQGVVVDVGRRRSGVERNVELVRHRLERDRAQPVEVALREVHLGRGDLAQAASPIDQIDRHAQPRIAVAQAPARAGHGSLRAWSECVTPRTAAGLPGRDPTDEGYARDAGVAGRD